MLLCMKYKIDTVDEYALKIGVSKNRALAILNQQVVLTDDEIKRNCEIFNCSSAYFLCLVEK